MNKRIKLKLKLLNEEFEAIQIKKRIGHSWSEQGIYEKRELEIQDELKDISNSLKTHGKTDK